MLVIINQGLEYIPPEMLENIRKDSTCVRPMQSVLNISSNPKESNAVHYKNSTLFLSCAMTQKKCPLEV